MIVKRAEYEDNISLINEKYYELCFSTDYENSDDSEKLFPNQFIKDIITILKSSYSSFWNWRKHADNRPN